MASCVLQLAAVRGLRETQPPSVGMVNVLRRGMEDASIFCRVRGEAALALAHGAGTEHNGAYWQRPPLREMLMAVCSATIKQCLWYAACLALDKLRPWLTGPWLSVADTAPVCQYAAFEFFLKHYQQRTFDQAVSQAKPQAFNDVSEYFVTQACCVTCHTVLMLPVWRQLSTTTVRCL